MASSRTAIARADFYHVIGDAQMGDGDAWHTFKEIVDETPELLAVALDLYTDMECLRQTLKIWLEKGLCAFGEEEGEAAAKRAALIAMLPARFECLSHEIQIDTIREAMAEENPFLAEMEDGDVIETVKEALFKMEEGLRAQTKKVTVDLHIKHSSTIIHGSGRVYQSQAPTLLLGVTRYGPG